MSVLVELHYTGAATIRTEVQAIVEHVLSGRPGEWRVSIVGSRAKEDWEMKVEGPNGFERSYTLVGTAGEHQPVAIGNLLLRLLPSLPRCRAERHVSCPHHCRRSPEPNVHGMHP